MFAIGVPEILALFVLLVLVVLVAWRLTRRAGR
jgi:hypothetical protein